MSNSTSTLSFQIGRPEKFLETEIAAVNLVINGTVYKHHLLDVVSILFGGSVRRSSYDIFTCSCGIAGCDGFHEPIEHARENGQVIWKIEDKKLSSVLEAKTLVFDEGDFEAARLSLLNDLKDLEAKGIYTRTLVEEDLSTEEGLFVGIPLDEVAPRALSYYEGQAKMYDVLDSASADGDAQNLRAIWADSLVCDPDLNPGWDNPSFFYMTPVNLAARLLNMGDSITPEDVERSKVLPDVAAILRAFYASSDTATAEAAFRSFRKFLAEDGIEDPDAKYFHTDINGPYVKLV